MSDPHPDPTADPFPADPGGPSDVQPEGRPDPARPDPYEGAVPPGYDWPTHGGYLGCLLGLMAACLVGAFAGQFVELFNYAHNITGIPNVLLILGTILVAVFALGRLGWVLGRRFYREYAVKPTWGEDDSYRPEWEVRDETSAEQVDAAEQGTDAPGDGGEPATSAAAAHEPLADETPAHHGV